MRGVWRNGGMKFVVGENERNPAKNLPRPRFVHHETHMEGPRRKLGTPAMGGERLIACTMRPPLYIIKRHNYIITFTTYYILSLAVCEVSSLIEETEYLLVCYSQLKILGLIKIFLAYVQALSLCSVAQEHTDYEEC